MCTCAHVHMYRTGYSCLASSYSRTTIDSRLVPEYQTFRYMYREVPNYYTLWKRKI
eukprot:COSAG02_NODE_14578_length_1258_cov_1.207075_3_plen_55_part_01